MDLSGFLRDWWRDNLKESGSNTSKGTNSKFLDRDFKAILGDDEPAGLADS